MIPSLDCCDEPMLHSIRVLSDATGSEVVLQQYAACHAYWKVTENERMNTAGSEDRLFEWFEPVTEADALKLLHGDGN